MKPLRSLSFFVVTNQAAKPPANQKRSNPKAPTKKVRQSPVKPRQEIEEADLLFVPDDDQALGLGRHLLPGLASSSLEKRPSLGGRLLLLGLNKSFGMRKPPRSPDVCFEGFGFRKFTRVRRCKPTAMLQNASSICIRSSYKRNIIQIAMTPRKSSDN